MRATLHMDYEPIYSADQSMEKSGRWYDKWYTNEFLKNKKN